ncbi:MAG: DUF4097 family beta strand repeat protein [Fimbriimonadaceae bacterium]|nr:DUF4097 family beta strand repeat protein [Fimbriimonadaceae bacterium]MCZ7581111.1 DUF4097 domain-containing protein [Fimbriimonadaceae bacterium]QOJ12257.1 MAG: DUF4097 family beta strand repeat protein [Chthonomonadaceae bacterium]
MKEEIRRIMQLVQEGKLSPEDAAELIDAFNAPEQDAGETESKESEGESDAASAEEGSAKATDPMKSFVDFMEGLGREVSTAVDWQDVARQVRTGAKKGYEGLQGAIDKVKKGKLRLGWFGAYEVREVTLPLKVAETKVLRIENPCGDVSVVGGSAESVVKAIAKVRGADEYEARENADAYTIVVEESDHQVLIRQPDIPDLSVDIEVTLALPLVVEVKTQAGDVDVRDTGPGCRLSVQSGDVKISGLSGPVEVSSQAGDMKLERIESPSVRLESKSGDIVLSDVKGNINARTARGNVTLQGCSGRTLSIESVSGAVNLDLEEPISGTVSVRTVDGDAVLAISDGSDCRVSLSTLRGDVLCDIVLEDEARMDQHITGRLGSGAGSLDVSAVHGGITLRLREHAATEEE